MTAVIGITTENYQCDMKMIDSEEESIYFIIFMPRYSWTTAKIGIKQQSINQSKFSFTVSGIPPSENETQSEVTVALQ